MSLQGTQQKGPKSPERAEGASRPADGREDGGITRQYPKIIAGGGMIVPEKELVPCLMLHLPGRPRAVKRAGGLGRPQRRAGLENGGPGGMSLLGRGKGLESPERLGGEPSTLARGGRTRRHRRTLPGAGIDSLHQEELDYSGAQMITLEGLTDPTAILPNGPLQSVKSIIFKS